MSSIRIAAIAVLVLAAGVAIGLGLPSDGSGITVALWAVLLGLCVAIANPLAVLWLTRGNARGATGLWLILAGALSALICVAAPLWIDLFASGDSLPGMLGQLALVARLDGLIALAGAIALVLGWSMWSVPRLTARRRAA
jgi:hypothetical protein